MQPNNLNISQSNIIEAFKVITNPLSSPQSILAANEYLRQSEQSPKLVHILFALYSTSSEPFIQLQSILLLLNIIKRNWQVKRGRSFKDEIQSFQNQKPLIRSQMLRIYPLHNLMYVKHINQALKFLARQDYPTKYQQLQNFMLQSLNTLYSQVLNSQSSIKDNKTFIIGFLSTYASKRLSHNQQTFNKYISQIIKIAVPISQKCHQIIKKSWQMQYVDNEIILTLLESAKKIDKIILYCLLCLPSNLQYIAQVQQIFQMILRNIAIIDGFILNGFKNNHQILGALQSYLAGVLQQVFKCQSLYPFLLVDSLQNYLHMILKMLVNNVPNKIYKNERLILTIVQANLKVFTCFTFYMSTTQFQGSVYNRKPTNLQLQQRLNSDFLKVFTPQNVTQLLSKMITQVMVSRSINSQQKDIIDQQMILEQTQVGSQDTLADSNAYQLAILLCKNIIKCFKKDVKPVLQNLFLSVGTLQAGNNSTKQKIIQNTMQLILVLPKIYDQCDLPLQNVMNLLSVLFSNHQYSMLARLIKNYHQYLNQTTLLNSFTILSQIVATPLTSQYITVDIIYQSALTMKKILNQNQSDIFPFQNFSNCIINLLSLLQNQKFSATPTLMWPLIKLTNQLLKLTNANFIIQQIGQKIIDCIYPLIQTKGAQQLTVCGIAQTLQQLLNIICACFKDNYLSDEQTTPIITKGTIKILYATYTHVINNVSNHNLQNVDSLYLLWLSLMRNYPNIQQQQLYNLASVNQMQTLNNNLRQLFGHLFDTVLQEDSVCAIQILQEYLICGLVQMNQQQLLGVFQKLLNGCLQEHKVRTLTALFSMYYCYIIVQQESQQQPRLQQEILKLLLQTLISYVNQISPQINGLRTLLMIIINYCVIKFGVKNIYQLFNSFCSNNYTKWFYAYCWSGQYVSNRLCHKINSTSYLKAIEELGAPIFGKMLSTPIQENYPLDTVLKTMVICLDPIKISQGWTTFSNMYKLILPTQTAACTVNSSTSRKIKLQLSGLIKEILITDQRESYQKLISQLFKSWDWGQDDVTERFDKITSNQILTLIKGNYKKDYDINQPD